MSTEELLWYTPWEYVPMIILVTVAITLILTLKRGLLSFQDANKKKLGAGTISEKLKYGIDYVGSHIATVVLSAVIAVLLPGLIYAAAGQPVNEAGCILIALAVSLVMGLWGAEHVSDIVDMIRNIGKISDLEKKEE